jgi:hypothetical protein
MADKRLEKAKNAPVAQWIEQRFPKPRALVRFRPGALFDRASEVAHLQEFLLSFILAGASPAILA